MKNLHVEVYVVDNNSVDGSVAMVASKFPWAKLIANKENTGFSRANNQAMRIAEGEYVLLLNPDTVVEEDTFQKVIDFMDAHPEAGGLGVKMVDGKGNFLPESKRGLPTPAVSFYKIFGLSKLFPKSRRFNRYHLGYLDNNTIHSIEILSGAFMLMRKSTLDKVGLLDEAFFMYGEDIDLSWRIIQGGWKNYYFPETRIIHYKGESTKKGSLNYVFVFYNAMIIFARKHFSEKNAKLFSFFINLAIWLRAGVAVVFRFLKNIVLPMMDFLLIVGGMLLISKYYATATHNLFDQNMVWLYSAVIALIWTFGAWFHGANERPVKPYSVIKPVLIGGVFIIAAYSLMPESWRFSRAVILLAPLLALGVLFINRVIYSFISTGKSGLTEAHAIRYAIVGSEKEAERVKSILQQTKGYINYWIVIPPSESEEKNEIGSISQLDEIVRVHEIEHVVFCAGDIAAREIIAAMSNISNKRIEFKIAPPESLYIIGSNSVETSGEVFMMDVNSVTLVKNKRAKRLLDIVLSVVFLALFPLLFFLVKEKMSFLKNIFQVLIGKKSWVGFSPEVTNGAHHAVVLPKIRRGVIDPSISKKAAIQTEENIIRMNVLYAKDYKIMNDLRLIRNGLRELGR